MRIVKATDSESIGPYPLGLQERLVDDVLNSKQLFALLTELADGQLDNPHRVFGRLRGIFESAYAHAMSTEAEGLTGEEV